MRSVDELIADGVTGRRVLLRADLNVPLDKTTRAITDDRRIRATLPTLQALLGAGARVAVTSHLGRPKGEPDPKYSLAPVARRLGELLGADVPLAGARRDGREGELRVRRAVGTAEVGGHEHAGAGVAQGVQGGQAGADPAVVGDLEGLLVQRDVQVGAQEHAPAGDALGQEFVERAHRQSFEPTSEVRSTRRLE